MATIPYNPFTNRSMIKKEDEFVGREQEINDILALIRNGNLVSVVGERWIGKSSLLYHLYLTGNRRFGDQNKEKYQFLYLDWSSPTFAIPENFAQWVLENLDLSFDPGQLKDNPWIALTKGLEKFKETQKSLILLMDVFEELTQNPELFNDKFFEALRSFGNGGFITIVTASLQTLKELTDQGILTAPFENIFTDVRTVPISNLDLDTALHLITKPVPEFDLIYEPTEIATQLVCRLGGRPYLLQVVMSDLVEYLNSKNQKIARQEDIEVAIMKMFETASSYFHHLWNSELNNSEREALRNLNYKKPLVVYSYETLKSLIRKEILAFNNYYGYIFCVPVFKEWIDKYV